MAKDEIGIKVTLIGESSVGKTSIINRYTRDDFAQDLESTLGANYSQKKIVRHGKKIRLDLWDTAGQEKYRAITKNLFLKVQGVLIVYDITNENSFSSLKSWVKTIKDECGKQMQMVIVGNKSDLEENRVIDKTIASEFAKEEKIDYIETSCKTGENIQKSISLLCEKVLENTEFTNDFSFTLDATSFSKKSKRKCC